MSFRIIGKDFIRNKQNQIYVYIYNKVRNEEENVFVDGTHDGVDGNECSEYRKKAL